MVEMLRQTVRGSQDGKSDVRSRGSGEVQVCLCRVPGQRRAPGCAPAPGPPRGAVSFVPWLSGVQSSVSQEGMSWSTFREKHLSV